IILLVTIVVTAVTTYSASRYIFEQPTFDSNVVVNRLSSSVLGEEREFLVHLPESYSRESSQRYPVLYVLDGSSEDIHTAKSAALMARIDVMPEIIIVGIPNVSGKGRQRDYTPPGMRQDIDEADSPEGKADQFLSFLKTELIPCIERDYRTDGKRMLAGNSRGGLFVIYSMIAEASLFDARFAHSPALWRDNDAIVGRLEHFLASSPNLHGFLYLSLGDAENDKMTKAFERAAATLKAQSPPSLRWRADLTLGGNHHNNAYLATPVGLHAYFAHSESPELDVIERDKKQVIR
ncbi:MAG: alpha/beta hydrolase-fold protein, partial [Acidobacteriota bacterium]